MAEENKNTKSEIALREERILEFWKENKIFDQSLNQIKGGKASPIGLRPREFIFYEGPPTANGQPGIHHLEARAFKDAIPRYKTMRGYHVRRKGGWDTHGLPVELQVEKKLGLNSKKAIEEYGISKFNQECRKSVWEYLDVWEKFTDRIGFWIDQDNPYVTYHNQYIESVWNIIKETHKQNLLYKDYRIVPWCPRCGTALSSHELAQGYEDVKDLSVYVKFKIATPTQKNTFILAWTTTPWTLPGNLALAVGENITYVKVKSGNEIFILAKARLSILADDYEILEEIKGRDLIGLHYEPLFLFYKNTILENEKAKLEKAYQVYGADFVTTEDGTGVVHTAVMYGQDDFVLGTKIGLPKRHLVGLDGRFLPGTGFLEGKFTKDEETAVEIMKDLAQRGLLLKKEKYEHSYPHCWRCKTALIYYARDSWYIKMSDPRIKRQLIDENQKIKWEPSHIRDGRFGEWLREIKDWAISRERYWGTPLPIWECEKCRQREVLGSIEEIKNRIKKSGNKYFVMRHGQAGNNVAGNIFHKYMEYDAKLTDAGREQVLENSKNFKAKIDIVLCSTLERAKETAEIVCEQINFPLKNVIYNKQIQEWEISTFFEGKERAVFKKYYDVDYLDNPSEILPDGESFTDVIKRMGDFIYDLEKRYSNKNILIVGHSGAMRALDFLVKGLSFSDLSSNNDPLPSLKNAEIREFKFFPLPHNENFELDLHRPYIDEVELVCAHAVAGQACGGNLVRTKEVMDVWLDSGAMPFAQDHYPFENKKWIEGGGYPADYICEAIDQTRGWFYTLHAIGILMNKGRAFRNAICLGHILDKEGRKMSKSVGNVVDPWTAMDKYGADTLRLWMYSINQPGESKNFDEKTVALLHQQIFGLLYNVLAFYELYRDKTLEENFQIKSGYILDRWILARLDELIKLTTESLENYKLLEPARAFKAFIGDLSTWYLRRSRERIKEGDQNAKKTLYLVLKTLAKLMAPFAPFAAEDIWQKLKTENDRESVHLEAWPKTKRTVLFEFLRTVLKKREKIIDKMKRTRDIVTLGLEQRQNAGIKVRQPLAKLEISKLSDVYSELIREELNVKEIVQVQNIDKNILLWTQITPELKEEGDYRELARGLQDLRKKMGLTPSDFIILTVETNDVGRSLILKFETEMKKTVLISKIEFKDNDGEGIKAGELVFKVKINQ